MDRREVGNDLVRAIAFLSRIPVPARFFAGHDGRMGTMAGAFPLAGAIIAAPAALVFGLLLAANGDPHLAGMIALAVQTLVTGALHEDGLADSADGLGGGRDREHALMIMKDSRIGAYGAIAMILSFGLRAAALSALGNAVTPVAAGLAILAAAGLSRAAMVWHWSALPPARSSGIAAAAGQPGATAVLVALASGALIAACIVIPSRSVTVLVVGLLACGCAGYGFTGHVRRRLGGHTGDTIGATQQLTEIAALCALALLH